MHSQDFSLFLVSKQFYSVKNYYLFQNNLIQGEVLVLPLFLLQKNGTPISYFITVLVVNIAKNAVNISYLLQGSLPECPSPPPPWIRPRPPCSTANPRRSSIHSRHHPVHGV